MKIGHLGALCVLLCGSATAQVYVAPYVDSQGNLHQGHMRSAPDGNPYNNYSTRGNMNPYTGQPGTVNPQPQQQIYQAPGYVPMPNPNNYMAPRDSRAYQSPRGPYGY